MGWTLAPIPSEIFFTEIFCNPRTAVENPLLNNVSHGGRRTFIVIDEWELDGSSGFWAEAQDDEQKAFGMHMKMFSAFMTSRMNHGSASNRQRMRIKRPRQRPWWKKAFQITSQEERPLSGGSWPRGLVLAS